MRQCAQYVKQNAFRQKYIFSVLSAVRGFMVATPFLALMEVANHLANCHSNKGQSLNCGMNEI